MEKLYTYRLLAENRRVVAEDTKDYICIYIILRGEETPFLEEIITRVNKFLEEEVHGSLVDTGTDRTDKGLISFLTLFGVTNPVADRDREV